jgi:hypothetical protein
MAEYCRTFTPVEEEQIRAYLEYAATTTTYTGLVGTPPASTVQEWFDAVLDAALITVNHPRLLGHP